MSDLRDSFEVKHFNELTTTELYEILKTRLFLGNQAGILGNSITEMKALQ